MSNFALSCREMSSIRALAGPEVLLSSLASFSFQINTLQLGILSIVSAIGKQIVVLSPRPEHTEDTDPNKLLYLSGIVAEILDPFFSSATMFMLLLMKCFLLSFLREKTKPPRWICFVCNYKTISKK